MAHENIKAYLKDLGEKEYELRKPLSNSTTTIQQRTQTLNVLDDVMLVVRGLFVGIRLSLGDEVASELERYFNQARSKKGLKAE